VSEKLPNVGRAGLIMMVSLLLSRVLGIVRDSIMTAQFGRGAETDAFGLAFQIPDLLFFLIAGGALSSAFIPVFSEYLHTDREEDAWKVFSVVVTVMSLVVTAFIVIAFVFAEPLVRIAAPGKQSDLVPVIAHMSRIVLPAQFAFFIGGIMFGTLYARQRFGAPGLGPNVYNLGMIFGALFLSSMFAPGIVGMAWGALGGAIIGNLVIPLLVMRSLGSKFKPSLDTSHPGVRKVFKLMVPVVLGLSLPGVYAMIMRGAGSSYALGINSSLDLANKLMQAPLGIFGQSLAIAVFPALSQFFAQQRMDMYRNQLAGTLRTVLYITVPISVIMLIMAPEIVTVVFEYGKFNSADTAVTAECLRMFAIGIAAWCMHPVLMRGFFALQQSVTPILLGTGATGLFLALLFALRETPLSYRALPLAGSLSAIALVVALLFAVARKTGGLDTRGILITLVKSAAGAAAMAVFLYGALLITPSGSGVGRNVWAFVKVFGVGLVGAWIYYGITRLMKMPETSSINRVLAKITRTPGGKGGSDETELRP
jgi:putative peptidoglycan lipid II flippase